MVPPPPEADGLSASHRNNAGLSISIHGKRLAFTAHLSALGPHCSCHGRQVLEQRRGPAIPMAAPARRRIDGTVARRWRLSESRR